MDHTLNGLMIILKMASVRNVIRIVKYAMMEDQTIVYNAMKDTNTILLLINVLLVKKYLDISQTKKINVKISVEMGF